MSIFAIIIEYNRKTTCNLHFTDVLDSLVRDHNCVFDNIESLINNKNNIKNYFMEKYKSIPKYFITFCGIGSCEPIVDELASLLKIVLITDDIHQGSSVRMARIPVYNKSYICLNTYGYQFNRWGLPNNCNNYFYPHSALQLLETNENPINKVLVSGRLDKIYPDRLYVANLAKQNNNIELLRCNFGYSVNNNENLIFGLKYYDHLNKYLACFVDTIYTRDYVLAKTFEICASGSLLLCMNEHLIHIYEQLGFIDGVNYMSCTKNNVEEKINYIVNPENRDIIDNIRRKGHELVKEKHNSKYRLKILLDILNDKHESNIYTNPIYDTLYKLAF